jgi:hypothetical protein
LRVLNGGRFGFQVGSAVIKISRMLRNTIIVAAVVASLALMCRAQAPVEQAPAQIKAQAALRARMAEAQEQMQRMQQAADEAKQAGQAKESSAPSHRVQVLLLEINANAEHPKLSALRAAAQSGKATAGLIAIADELIAAGVGFTDCNVSTVIRADDKSRIQYDDEVPYEVMNEEKKVKEWGAKRLGYSLECGYWGSAGEPPLISLMFEYGQAPHSKHEVPGFRGRETLRWSGLCSRESEAETVLLAETPRKSGNAGGDAPPERYLLLRVDAAE